MKLNSLLDFTTNLDPFIGEVFCEIFDIMIIKVHFLYQFFSTKAEGLTNRTRGLVGSLLFRTPLR